MKKFLFSVATVFAANFSFGQITLEHTFPNEENIVAYSTQSEMFYLSTNDNVVKIYNSNFTLYKTFTVAIPTTHRLYTSYEWNNMNPYVVSKNIFNTDNKLEVLVAAIDYDTYSNSKLLLIDEDGVILKDFNTNPATSFGEVVEIYHDSIANQNKIKVRQSMYNNGTYQYDFSEVYSLPTNILANKEIESKGKLSAFPIPADKILNVINPENGANKIEIFDTSGKLVTNKIFRSSENTISVDVSHLAKGIYIYKVGELSSKFIKN